MEVKCTTGCPFRLFASWDSRRACFVVKSVDDEHSCTRNMEGNRQMTSTWLAKQFLEIFKARPHWPAKELIETVRQAYRVAIKSALAYKVKYKAHKLLHGSMEEHYAKLGRYLQALRDSDAEICIRLLNDERPRRSATPVFQRLFICFDGVRKGWQEGCRRFLSIDACFLKTFLGGQLLAVVGRDANDQMYPVAWAIVEGENNSSWSWFLSEVQTALNLGQGEGLTIVSDEHLVSFNYICIKLHLF